MIRFTTEDGAKAWVPIHDITMITERDGKTSLGLKVQDRSGPYEYKVGIKEPARIIVEQMKQIPKGE